MAVRDRSIDEKIISSARKEFLSAGFEKASLRKIARDAGLTTGALYSRYKNKDMLFCSLLGNIMQMISEESGRSEYDYEMAYDGRSIGDISSAIKNEESAYLDMMRDHYDECVLFFCCSDGSSAAETLHSMLKGKAERTIKYLKSIAKEDIDYNGVEAIMYMQFGLYRNILEKGLGTEETISAVKTAEGFLEEGWKALFKKIL